jgi:hypothetical protein
MSLSTPKAMIRRHCGEEKIFLLPDFIKPE